MREGYRGPAKSIQVLGETWELVKDATDPSVMFAFERVDINNYACEKVNDRFYMLLFSGYLRPTPQSLEAPQRLVFVGFCERPLTLVEMGPAQLRKMHVYKANMKNFANEFAKAFVADESSKSEQYDIKPFPVGVEDDGRTEQTDEQ